MEPSAATAPPRRRFVGRSGQAPAGGAPGAAGPAACPPSAGLRQAPAELLADAALNAAIGALLPAAYDFEVHKTIHQIRRAGARRVALQMPEGLTLWACALVDLVERFTEAEAVVMGDVTYGACCVDDYTAKALGCDMLVHYGHSCLVPVDQTAIRTLYVFVEIQIDRQHLADTIRRNFPACISGRAGGAVEEEVAAARPEVEIGVQEEEEGDGKREAVGQPTKLAVVGTVQFVAAVQNLKADLENAAPAPGPRRLAIAADDRGVCADGGTPQGPQPGGAARFEVTVPQIKPLSPGEILGCTAPRLDPMTDALLYVGDGRFHLESIMIANPAIPAFRYDPYDKRITREGYDHALMRKVRGEAVREGQRSLAASRRSATGETEEAAGWAVVLGTLGRQGSLAVLNSITTGLAGAAPHLPSPAPILLSELSPAKMALFAGGADVFVQTSCPRLSIDWGYAFPRPLLSPYEAKVALGQAQGWQGMHGAAEEAGPPRLKDYPMDFYADASLGDWTPRHGKGVRRGGGEAGRPMPRRKVVMGD